MICGGREQYTREESFHMSVRTLRPALENPLLVQLDCICQLSLREYCLTSDSHMLQRETHHLPL